MNKCYNEDCSHNHNSGLNNCCYHEGISQCSLPHHEWKGKFKDRTIDNHQALKDFSFYLYKARRDRDWTRGEMGKYLHTNQQRIYKMETREMYPTLIEAIWIMDKLGITIKIGGKENG